MKKTTKACMMIGLLLMTMLVLLMCFPSFASEYVGPMINDGYKALREGELANAALPDTMRRAEVASVYRKDAQSGRLELRVGCVIQTELPEDACEKEFRSIPGLKNVDIYPYSHEKAAYFGFTGIQKELHSGDTAGYYIVGITCDPLTMVDKRNTSR